MVNKKIAFFIPRLVGGGAEKVALLLAQSFAESGYSVDILCIEYKKQINVTLEKYKNIKIICFNKKRAVAAVMPIKHYLKTEAVDAFLCFMTESNLVVTIACLLSGSKTQLYWSEHVAYTKAEQLMPKLHRAIYPFLISLLSKRAKKIIAVAHGVSDDFKMRHSIDNAKLVVIYNPVINPEIIDKINEPVSKELQCFLGTPYLISVGRLSIQKDFSTLIHALAYINKTNKSLKLLIAGEGPEKNKLAELINELNLQEVVHLLGYQSNPYPLVRRAKCYVMSSAWEGLPLVLIEALACNTPIVSTDCVSGPAEILENGKWGSLVPVGDSKALGQAIIEQLENSSFKNVDLTQRANDFTADKIAQQYLELMFGDENKL